MHEGTEEKAEKVCVNESTWVENRSRE